MIVDPTVITTFVAVMDHGSVVAAARIRGYSAAAVSRQMSWFQRRLGVTLFVPDGRSIKPTDAAFELVPRCREIVDELRRFEAYADGFADSAAVSGVLR